MKKPSPDPRLSSQSRAATPIAFIAAILAGYRRYGADPANALARAGISPALLERPEARVTASQMEIMSGTAMQELDDEALGWFSRRLPWGSYGMLCRASITSPDLGVALKRWCRHHRLLTDDIALSLEVNGSEARFTLSPRCELGELREFCLVTLLRYVLGYACWAIDSRIPLTESRFPFPAPPHADAYSLMFPGPVRFDAEFAGLSFDARYLELPIRRDEAALQTMLQRALPLTVLQYRRDRLLVEGVRRFLRDPASGPATAETVAEHLHVSVRTLHRQLHEEGSSLQRLKDDARRDRAIELLNRSSRSIKQISALVGFGNEKSFSRAFRTWTGVPPQTFREKGLGDKRA
ncbi:AraC family transcriptional regulator [Zoogloea sp.]|uniref:AraC family transcriptional regulator n=1 Tax=Zoogloea sp. TaxID=49181 RepID=UPI002B9206CC|nr:AraC family transcriptional regulator [Zoogloea sp.]HQA09603.1 AraC family transcriptional regulator [Zoogloea sp.]